MNGHPLSCSTSSAGRNTRNWRLSSIASGMRCRRAGYAVPWKKQKRCLRLFLCNLYVSHYYEKPVAVPLKYSAFTEGRYKKLFIKRVPFLKVFRFLEAQGVMTVKKGIVTYSSSFNVDWDNVETTYYPKYEKGCVTRI